MTRKELKTFIWLTLGQGCDCVTAAQVDAILDAADTYVADRLAAGADPAADCYRP